MTQRAWIGLLDAGAARLAQAQAWRDETLLPQIAALPGMRKAHVYCAFNVPQLALIGQFATGAAPRDAAALAGPADMPLRQELGELTSEMLQPGTHDQEDEPILYSVRFTVPADWTAEFDRWYEQEHIPMIYGCRHWSMSRRYRLQATPGGSTHLALHYLSDARGLDAPQLKAARVTPWRNRFLDQSWFTNADKMIYFRQTPSPKTA